MRVVRCSGVVRDTDSLPVMLDGKGGGDDIVVRCRRGELLVLGLLSRE